MIEIIFFISILGFSLFIVGSLGLFYSAELARCNEESCEPRVVRFDILGTALLALGVALMILSIYGYF